MTRPVVRKAIFPAAGLGTRFLPATKAQPKEMLPLVDKPTIQYGVEEAIASGIEQVIMVTGGGKRAIVDHFDRSLELEHYLEQRGKSDMLHILAEVDELSNQLVITYVQQKEPLGLGHAVWTARLLVEGEACAVLLADDVILGAEPCLKQLCEVHSKTGATVIAVRRFPRSEVGRYILTPEVFAQLDRAEPGTGKEIQLTDAIKRTVGTSPVVAYEFEGDYFDTGTVPGYLRANLMLAMRREGLREQLAPLLRELLETPPEGPPHRPL